MNLPPHKDINKVVYDILKQSKSFDIFPTPVDKIAQFAELYINHNTDIHSIPNHYISKNIDALTSALRKVFGALDRREKIIYLNPNLKTNKKNFVKLHEVGHEVLLWQKEIYEFIDDEETINPETKEQFEAEANYFASASLFQLDRFESLIQTLPLEIKTCMYLSKKFGSSIHAAIRRYAEVCNKRCALLILEKPTDIGSQLEVRNYFQSKKFTKEFGIVEFPQTLDIEWPFVQDYIIGKRFRDNGFLSIVNHGKELEFEYQYFNNTYNVFILIIPEGEKIKTNTKIFLSGE